MAIKKKPQRKKAPKKVTTAQMKQPRSSASGKRKTKKEKCALVKKQRAATEAQDSFQSSSVRPTDVLLGRGSGVSSWRGNKLFRRIVWEHRERYVQAYRNEKRDVALAVVEELQAQDPPGRFLERIGPHTFRVVPEQRTIEKTCQCLREKKHRDPSELVIEDEEEVKQLVDQVYDPSLRPPKTSTSKKKKTTTKAEAPAKKTPSETETKKETNVSKKVTAKKPSKKKKPTGEKKDDESKSENTEAAQVKSTSRTPPRKAKKRVATTTAKKTAKTKVTPRRATVPKVSIKTSSKRSASTDDLTPAKRAKRTKVARALPKGKQPKASSSNIKTKESVKNSTKNDVPVPPPPMTRSRSSSRAAHRAAVPSKFTYFNSNKVPLDDGDQDGVVSPKTYGKKLTFVPAQAKSEDSVPVAVLGAASGAPKGKKARPDETAAAAKTSTENEPLVQGQMEAKGANLAAIFGAASGFARGKKMMLLKPRAGKISASTTTSGENEPVAQGQAKPQGASPATVLGVAPATPKKTLLAARGGAGVLVATKTSGKGLRFANAPPVEPADASTVDAPADDEALKHAAVPSGGLEFGAAPKKLPFEKASEFPTKTCRFFTAQVPAPTPVAATAGADSFDDVFKADAARFSPRVPGFGIPKAAPKKQDSVADASFANFDDVFKSDVACRPRELDFEPPAAATTTPQQQPNDNTPSAFVDELLLASSQPGEEQDSKISAADDNMFSMLPPQMTAFYSGIFSDTNGSGFAAASSTLDHHHDMAQATTAAAAFAASVDTTTIMGSFGKATRDDYSNPESPSTVVGANSLFNVAPPPAPPRLQAAHSLFLEDDIIESEADLKTAAVAAWEEWVTQATNGSSG